MINRNSTTIHHSAENQRANGVTRRQILLQAGGRFTRYLPEDCGPLRHLCIGQLVSTDSSCFFEPNSTCEENHVIRTEVLAIWYVYLLSYSWNPAVGSDCSGLLLGYYVCVGIPSGKHTNWRCHNHYYHRENHERVDGTITRADGPYVKLKVPTLPTNSTRSLLYLLPLSTKALSTASNCSRTYN